MNMISKSIAALDPVTVKFITNALEDGCRYRWLRNEKSKSLKVTDGCDDLGKFEWLSGAGLDAAIDAEIDTYFKEQGIEK